MGLDFWGVKLKDGVDIKNEKHIWAEITYYHPSFKTYLKNFEVNDYIFEDSSLQDYMDDELKGFVNKMNDDDWWNFCKDTIKFFPSGDPISSLSMEHRDMFAEKLNQFIKENPNYEYNYGYNTHYSNKKVRLFIKYVNLAKEHNFIWWISW